MIRRLVLLLCSIAFIVMFGWNLGEKFLSYFLAETPQQASQVSLVFFTIYASVAFSSFISSRFIERYGYRKSISMGIILYSPFMLVVAFSGGFTLSILTAALLGLGGSLFWVGLSSLVASRSHGRGKTMGLIQGSAILASSLSFLIGGFLIYFLENCSTVLLGPLSIFLFGALVLVLASILSLKIPREKPVKRMISLQQQLSFFKDPNLVSLGFISLVCSSFVGVTYPMIPLIVKNLPPILAPSQKIIELSLVLFLLYFTGFLSAIYFGRTSDITGRKRVFYMMLLAGTLSSSIIFLSNDLWALSLGIFVYAPFLWLARVPVVASVGDMFKGNQSYAVAVTSFSESMGVALGALISALLVLTPARDALLSFKIPFLAVGMLFLVAIFVTRRLPLD